MYLPVTILPFLSTTMRLLSTSCPDTPPVDRAVRDNTLEVEVEVEVKVEVEVEVEEKEKEKEKEKENLRAARDLTG